MSQSKSYKLAELVTLLGAELKGDANYEITRVASLETAIAGELSFISNAKHREQLIKTKAGVVILTQEELEHCPTQALVVKDPYYAFAKVAQLFNDAPQFSAGINPKATIADSAEIDSSVYIGPAAVIGERVKIGAGSVIEAGVVISSDVIIGEHCHIYPNVSIYHRVKIGSRVIIHSGVILGADGFGMARNPDNTWVKFPQLGSVVIGNDVEIGANTCVDRGALDDTVIEDGVKLDNLIQVAHNVQIGAHTAIAGCVGIAGSTTIGKHCMIGGHSSINGHINLCDGSIVTGTSSVAKSTNEPGMYSSGIPALPTREWGKLLVRLLQIDSLFDRLKKLEKKVNAHDDRE